VPPPHSDPSGATYAFEKGVRKASGSGGWADVWKRGCFGWEYKSRGGDLEAAHDQLLCYAGALENPPLLITSDMVRIVVRTNWTNAVSERREFGLEDLRDPTVRSLLKACWTDPERWRPAVTRQSLTEKAAGEFAELARRLRDRGHEPQTVAHFVNRLVFCLFADDVDLLPDNLLSDLLAYTARKPAAFAEAASELFRAMRDRWLNPPELVEILPEVVPGFPDRLLPRNPAAAAILKKRTLTNLYNTRGTPEGAWLDNLHRAVAAAYGWPADITTDEALARLLALNHARAA
jgi:hypothetical protein